jgi:ribulose 1,5-bisphosphate carboxylase large subunit-like protein
MWGGYMNDDENELKEVLAILHKYNVIPALSCGMHPGIVNAIVKRFGNDFMANCGGSIQGHPRGTIGGAMAMRQAIDKTFGIEYEEAIKKLRSQLSW